MINIIVLSMELIRKDDLLIFNTEQIIKMDNHHLNILLEVVCNDIVESFPSSSYIGGRSFVLSFAIKSTESALREGVQCSRNLHTICIFNFAIDGDFLFQLPSNLLDNKSGESDRIIELLFNQRLHTENEKILLSRRLLNSLEIMRYPRFMANHEFQDDVQRLRRNAL